jgi:putative ABC transport system ATP-binding protein
VTPGPDTAVPLFELAGVVVQRGERTILGPVSCTLPDVDVTCIVGASGSGKSTVLRLLNRLDAPTAGTVRFRGDDVAALDPLGLRRTVAYLSQRAVCLPGTVLDNLRVADPHLDTGPAVALCARVGLDDVPLDQDAPSLSGGEAQRLCLARALLTGPTVVLADEPTASLDGEQRDGVERLVGDLAADGVRFVWVTHDADQLRRLASHAVVLAGGAVVAGGSLDELARVDDRRVRAVLGGGV